MPRWPRETEAALPLDEGAEFRKLMRRKLATLTGFMIMEEELKQDLAEIRAEISTATAAENNNTRQPRIPKALPAPPDSEPHSKYQLQTPEQAALTREEKSKRMKAQWALRKAAGLGKEGKLPPLEPVPAEQPDAGEAANNEQTPIEQPVTRGRGRPPKKNTGGHTKQPPMIGFNTNAQFIYEHAFAHNRIIHLGEARKAAASSDKHSNLAYGIRMTVAIAEMKRKGFLVTEGRTGESKWRLTSKAITTYQRERARAQKESEKYAKTHPAAHHQGDEKPHVKHH